MLEGIFELREKARLVEEPCSLEVRKAATERLLGQLGNGLQEHEGHLLTDDGCQLQQAFLRGWEAVDPGGEDRLHGCRYLNTWAGLRQAIGTRGSHQDVRLDQCADGLLQEERIPFSALDQERF